MENKYQKHVFGWLISGSVLVLMMVVIGGITRLTQSGLSMVRWEPLIGAIPPLTEESWQAEFEAYQATPEFSFYNSHFSLEDFKKIYFWEYLHRLIGRVLGLVFLIPALFFWMKGVFDPVMKKRVFIIFLGGLFQGVLGWYMVKSGLVDKPHVSHYRLAAHLLTALALAAFIFWVALDWNKLKSVASKKINRLSILLLGLLGIQLFYGAFVAGLKAGKMYNTFTKMGREWFPDDLSMAFEIHGWAAILANGAVVQFVHRYLAYAVVFLVLLIWRESRKLPNGLQVSINWLLGLVGLQFFLGVLTLLWAVPVSLGVLHQLGAVFLMLSVVFLIKKSG